MGEKNNIISAFQFSVIGTFLGTALYEGVASVFLFRYAKTDAWISCIIAVIIGFIPLYLFIKIINYEPDKNIIEKIQTLFSPKIAFFVNLILAIYVAALFLGTSWTLFNFTSLKYLTETPQIFISFIYLVAVFYMSMKGIQTIGRTSEILFYAVIFFHILVTTSLTSFVEIENLKPFFANGIFKVFKESISLLTYTVIPFFLLTIVPKNDIKNNKKLTKYLVFGYVFAMLSSVLITFMVTSIIGIDLGSLYRFPAYYVHKKIMFAGVIENVENFTASHWIFSMFILMAMASYYLSRYFNNLFKIKKEKKKLIPLALINISMIFLSIYVFTNATEGLKFLHRYLSEIFTLSMTMLLLAIFISIILKKKRQKLTS